MNIKEGISLFFKDFEQSLGLILSCKDTAFFSEHPTSWQRIGCGLQLLLELAASSVRHPVPSSRDSLSEGWSEQQFLYLHLCVEFSDPLELTFDKF